MKKIVLFLLVVAIVATGCNAGLKNDDLLTNRSAGNANLNIASSGKFNYGEVLQKSIWFYDEQRCGQVEGSDNRVNWRGDCHLHDGSDNGVDLTGGWHDAGDHIKFALPQSYSAGMLMWGLYENKDAYVSIGEYENLLENIKWATDYLKKCHTAPNELWYQVSNKAFDHNWWGPAEVFPTDRERPSYKLTLANPGSAATADVAATMAMASIIFAESDPAYAADCLVHAKQLYTFADTARSDEGYTAASGMYNSWSGFWDELQWAAVWLYLATDDAAYLSAAEGFTANLNRQGQSSDIEYQWSHCWDDKHYGAMLLLSRITGKQEYHDFIQKHLDWWAVDGAKGWTPGGLAWSSMWGSLRYASTSSFLAFVYADSITDATLQERYRNFGIKQLDYCLGDNPNNFSYVIGFGSDYPQRPHHRLAHSSWSDQMTNPSYHRHTLYGALVGGPESIDDNDYNDEVNDYESNEVATDYNAGFTSALGYMVKFFGGSALSNFPQPEEPTNVEFFNEATINNSASTYTELKILTNNKSGWPARHANNLSYRYFFDISEVIAAGDSIADITVATNYVEFPITKEIKHLSDTIYYVEVTFVNDTDLYPGGQSPFAGEVQLRIAAPSGTTYWDPTNDFSYIGLGSGNTGLAITENIPVYENGVLIYGNTPIRDEIAPEQPTGLNGVASSQSAVDLSWIANTESDLASYNIYRSSTTLANAVLVGNSSINSFSDSGLTASTSYIYAITALDGSGNESTKSLAITVITHDPDTTAPDAPTGLSAVAAGENNVNLDWNNNLEADFANYKVYRSDSQITSADSSLFIGNASTSDFADSGLIANTTYYYAITALDTSGNESTISINKSVTTDSEDITPPSVPSGLVAGTITASSIEVSWTENTEADFAKYIVYQGNSSTFTKATGTLIGEATIASKIVGSLSAETTYFIKVCSVDEKGNESDLSNAISATTLTAPDASMTLEWNSTQISATTNTIGGTFVITNTGTEDLSLSEVSIKYFLTKDKDVDIAFWCDHAGGTTKGNYTSFTDSVSGIASIATGVDTDTVIEITFSSAAPALGSGDSVNVNIRVTRVDWSNFDQSNDFSFAGDSHIALYYGTSLISGMEP